MTPAAEQIQLVLKNWSDDDLSTASRLLWHAGIPNRVMQLPARWWTTSLAFDSGLWLTQERNSSPQTWLVNQQASTLQLNFQSIGTERATPPDPGQLERNVLSLWPGCHQLPRFWSLSRAETAGLIVESVLWISLAVLFTRSHPAALLVPLVILALRHRQMPMATSLRATQMAMASLQQWLRLPFSTILRLRGTGSGLIQLLLQAGQRQPEVLRDLAVCLLILVGATLLLASAEPVLSLAVLACCLLWLLSVAWMTWSNRRLMIHRDRAFGQADRRSLDLLRINASLRLAGAEERALRYWNEPQCEALRWQRRLDRNRAIALLFALACTGAALWLALNAIGPGHVLALIVLQLVCSLLLIDQLRSLISLQMEWSIGKGLLNSTPEWRPEAKDPGTLLGFVSCEGVSYRYDERRSWALKDLAAEIPAGSYVALVGATGSGKSTFLHLLLGFAEPQKGVLRFDGTDTRLLQQDLLRPQIGAMLQEGHLVGQTIWEVLAAGRPLTMTAAMEAIEAVGFSDDLKTLPMGLETPLHDGGRQLSGGQRQKLAIARALIGQPRLLLLDEPTSALDPISEATVLRTLRQLSCTRILIAHELSIVKEADLILVLQGGRLVQQGDYTSLANVNGAFRDLIELQER